MCRKLICLISFVLVLSATGNVSAELVAHWTFDEGSGTTAFDSSGNGNDGTFNGNATWAVGHLGGALQLDGSGDYLNCGLIDIDSAVTGGMSVCAWINKPAGGDMKFCSNRQASNAAGGGFTCTIYNDRMEMDLTNASQRNLNRDSDGPTVPANTWVHVAWVYDDVANTFNEYHDGVLADSSTENVSVGISTQEFRIGADAPNLGRYVNGLIDDLRIYNSALSEQEILGVMQGGGVSYPFASRPSPADGALYTDTWVNLSWNPGDSAVSHDVYLGDNFDDVNDGAANAFRGSQGDTFLIAGVTGFPFPDGLVPGTTYYWRIDEVNDTEPNSPWVGPVWSFSVPPKKAYDPSVSDGATFVARDVELRWTAGFGAKLHTVYFGDDLDTVTNATDGVQQGTTTFNPGPLELDRTYYWRVDEFDAFAMHTGDVWSFTTTLPGLGNAVAERWENILTTDLDTLKNSPKFPNNPDVTETVTEFSWNGPNTDDYGGRIEAWVYVPGTGDYTFWLNADDQGELWLSTDDDSSNVVLIASESSYSGLNSWGSGEEQSAPIPLIGGERYYIMALWKEGGGGDHCQVAWRGPGIPDRTIITGTYLSPYEPISAYGAKPSNFAAGVTQTPTLQWKAGLNAASHELYFGTDPNALANATKASPEFVGTRQLGAESYEPAMLAWDATYYWRVDEVNAVNPDSPWIGKVWSFTTADFGIVDDFEGYSSNNPIWENWRDGIGFGVQGTPGYYAGNGTGSAAGDDTVASTAEENIVHGGNQAMPVWYNNTATAISETELTLSPAQNWTANNATTLSIWFHGDPANLPGQLYVKVNGVQVLYDGAAVDLSKPMWQVWNIDLAAFSGGLQSVSRIALGVQGNGATGKLIFDDISLYQSAPEPPVQVFLEAEAGTLGASWRLNMDPTSVGGRNIGSNDGDGDDNDTAPGPEWTAVYSFDVPVEGVYKVVLRAQENGSDSFWVRIVGATSQTHEDPDQPGSGWVRFNEIDAASGWSWDEVHSNDHSNTVVNWTLPAGPHTLEIAKREDGVLLDAILITDDVD